MLPLLQHPRDELFRQSLAKLREQLVKANTLVREANFLAEEMNKLTDYQVTLQIPAANLSANRKVGIALGVGRVGCRLVDPADWSPELISVSRSCGNQVLTLDAFELVCTPWVSIRCKQRP